MLTTDARVTNPNNYIRSTDGAFMIEQQPGWFVSNIALGLRHPDDKERTRNSDRAGDYENFKSLFVQDIWSGFRNTTANEVPRGEYKLDGHWSDVTFVHRIVVEKQFNVLLEKREHIVPKDGNHFNCAISNLLCKPDGKGKGTPVSRYGFANYRLPTGEITHQRPILAA